MFNMPAIDMVATGRNITRLREAAGLTVRDLQDIFGFATPQAIYKWQHGTAIPTIDNLVVLAAVLEVPENKAALRYLEGIEKMMHIKDGEKNICLCHFPLAEWNGFFHGTWHIYGHIHSRKAESYEYMKTKERALNAGCMINNYAPATFSELVRNNKIFQEE